VPRERIIEGDLALEAHIREEHTGECLRDRTNLEDREIVRRFLGATPRVPAALAAPDDPSDDRPMPPRPELLDQPFRAVVHDWNLLPTQAG
jgi:hypothetical protein